MRLSNKVAIVTGGALGFGKAIVERLVADGAKVVLIDMNVEAGEAFAKGNPAIAFLQGDVSKEESWRAALELAISAFGGVQILVNNAGVTRNVPAHLLDEQSFDLMTAIHLKALFWSTKVVFPHFIEHGDGRVVNIGSTGATRPRPGFAWYNMTKGGVLVATKSLAIEYAPTIRVNCIIPALGNTSMLAASFGGKPVDMGLIMDMIPMKRITEPSDIANAASFLVSDEASFITGTHLEVDGGRGI